MSKIFPTKSFDKEAKMEIERIPVEKLNPAPYNPRKDLKPGDAEYQHIKNSIDAFGYIDPIIWNSRTGNIVGGHQRFKILKAQGATEIDCVVVDFDEQTEKAANAALNKAQGDWDLEKLDALLADVRLDFDMERFGFDFAEDTKEPEDDNFDIDEAEKSIEIPETTLGDLWKLGRHWLLCGDSTKQLDVKRLMRDKLADLLITDPPYNVSYEGGTKDKLTIMNDSMAEGAFRRFLTDAFKNAYFFMRPGASAYVFHADTEGYNFRGAFCDAGFKLAQTCIWVKNSMVMGRQDYHWQHEPVMCGDREENEEFEPVLYGWNPESRHAWHSDRKQKTVWYFNRPSKSKDHPTMKPVELIAYPIKNSSVAGSIVLDLFGGSGSTLIACEQMNRSCFMMELDPKYCDVIIKRWETLTGQKAVRNA